MGDAPRENVLARTKHDMAGASTLTLDTPYKSTVLLDIGSN